MRDDDRRTDDELAEAGRAAARLGLAIAWSSGIEGAQAKAASGTGKAAWKNATGFPDEENAAGHYVERCRRKNPVVPASCSNLVILEIDLDYPRDAYPSDDEVADRVGGLLARLELELPETVTVRSRRGLHFYYRPDVGCAPLKVQLDELTGIAPSRDGYVVGVPGLHELAGVVYHYVRNGALAVCPARIYERLIQQGQDTRERVWAETDEGKPVEQGFRNETIFHAALKLLRNARRPGEPEILERLERLNQQQCRPPLSSALVLKQYKGALKWAAAHPTEQELLRARARQALLGEETAKEPPRRVRRLLHRALSSVPARPVEWLITGMVPLGTLTLVAGVGGLGKTGLLLAWGAQVTSKGGHVAIVSYEDAVAEVLRPRFEALGGDLDLLHELYVDPLDGSVSFPVDLPDLDEIAVELDVKLILLDPVSASIDTKLDSHRDRDVRVVLGQLHKLAERQRLAVVQNAHLNKAPSTDPYMRINGSTAFYNASRSVVTVTEDEDEEHRLVTHHKSNYGVLAPVQRWKVEVVEVPYAGGVLETARLVYVEDAEDVSRQDVLAGPKKTGSKEQAMAFLELELSKGRRPSKELKEIAKNRVPKITERTLQTASQSLGVIIEEEATETGRMTYWSLPEGGRANVSSTESWRDPSEPSSEAKKGGRANFCGRSVGATPIPTRTCVNHPGEHTIVAEGAGLLYLSCGCHEPAHLL